MTTIGYSQQKDRVREITHHGKHILLIDFSNCSAAEVERTARKVPDHVTAQPLNSVLLLVDFSAASFDEEAIRTMKESAVFNKAYVKKSAWVGAESVSTLLQGELERYSGRKFTIFKNRKDALDWLTKG